ncbi:hypothetical protein EUTSA_v10021235mg [Eutrema salsugineum]|uniref:BHLH domain-containing protein n=1 Tax=Eutrema salsugineum TaxID=72664 RepID=V4LB63_EUTSA|nr:transcription factor bHLH117 [Eutrema salsugineum]ESQ47665.1 hypothetical protein EUTSA_v10021235mg [Eutrema salsugineum]
MEYESLSELPPLPQELESMEYSYSTHFPYAINPLESLPPFPSSDFAPYYGGFTFSDQHGLLHLQEHVAADSLFLDSSLSLLTESTRLEKFFSDDEPFLHLPHLKSFEKTTTTAVADDTKPPFLSLAPPLPDEKLRRRRSVVKRTFTISPSPQSSYSKSRSPATSSSSFSQSTYGGDRRRRVSDKIRSLEKLMPWESKMSLAKILDEAHKYVKFLQSQIASLRWMPLESVYCTAAGEVGEEVGGGGVTDPLKSLTRQQILQVLANSPGARTQLYTRGVCVFSYEQLLSVEMMAQSARNL